MYLFLKIPLTFYLKTSLITYLTLYRLAIFQLLDDIEAKAPQLALFSFCMGCINVPLYLMLLTGATFKKSFFLVPWLVMALVEHLVIGVPLIVFFGLISLIWPVNSNSTFGAESSLEVSSLHFWSHCHPGLLY